MKDGQRIRLVPNGLVRDPVTRVPLPKEGADVTLDTYWRRRIADGSVTATKIELEAEVLPPIATEEPRHRQPRKP
jgi:regulator of protease activity HflC (stomatin/prohibitin superfamily)